MVWATAEASTVVVARLPQAATEVAATDAESTRSIQLNPAKSKRASWANLTVGPASFRSVYLSHAVLFFLLQVRQSRDSAIATARAGAEMLVAKHQADILAVADALVQRLTLKGPEVRALLNSEPGWLVGLARFELATYGLGNRRSIHLSYSP